MIHALMVDGAIVRFDGSPFQVLEKIAVLEMETKKVEYLFGAHSQEEFSCMEREHGVQAGTST